MIDLLQLVREGPQPRRQVHTEPRARTRTRREGSLSRKMAAPGRSLKSPPSSVGTNSLGMADIRILVEQLEK
jgi:hypothetical protein